MPSHSSTEPAAHGKLLLDLSRELLHALAPHGAHRVGCCLQVDCADSSHGLVRVVVDTLRGDVHQPISGVARRDPAAEQADGPLVLDTGAVLA